MLFAARYRQFYRKFAGGFAWLVVGRVARWRLRTCPGVATAVLLNLRVVRIVFDRVVLCGTVLRALLKKSSTVGAKGEKPDFLEKDRENERVSVVWRSGSTCSNSVALVFHRLRAIARQGERAAPDAGVA